MWSLEQAKKWIVVGSIFTVAAIILRDVLLGSGLVITGDAAFPLKPQVFVFRSFYVWYPYHYLGWLNTQVARFPIHVMWSLPTFVGLSPELSQKLWYLFLFITPALSMYYFSGIIVRERLAKLTSAFFYMVNPIMLGRSLGGSVFFLASYAVLPFVFAFYFKALKTDKVKYSLIMGLVLAFAISCSVHILYMIAFVFLLHIFYSIVFRRKILEIAKIIKMLMISGSTCFAVSFFWLFFLFIRSPFGKSQVWPLGQLFYNSTHTSLLNVVRLLGGLNLVQKGFTYGYLSMKGIVLFIIVLVCSLLLLLMVALGWIFRWKDEIVGFLFLTTLASIFLGKGPNAPFGDLFIQIYLRVPGFGTLFRDPSKFLIFVALSYAVLIGVALEEIFKRGVVVIDKIESVFEAGFLTLHISKKNLFKVVSTLFVTLLIFTYSYPMFLGFYGNLTPITVPTEYLETSDWLSNQNEEFRTYWVPSLSDYIFSTNYEWNPHGTAVFIPESVAPSEKPVINWNDDPTATSRYSNDMAYFAYSLMYNNWTNSLGKVLGLLNAKYVVVDESMPSDVRHPSDVRYPPPYFLNVLEHQNGISLIYPDGSLKVFENTWFKPRVSTVSHGVLIIGGRTGIISLVNIADFYPSALFFSEQLQTKHHDEVLSRSNSTKIFIVDKNYSDFVFSLIDRSHFLSPYLFVPPGSRKDSWRANWSPDGSWASYRGEVSYDEAYAYSTAESHMKVPFSVKSGETYDVWIRVAFGPQEGKLTLTLDEHVLTWGLDCNDPRYLGFRWVKVTSQSLNEGEHTITLYNEGGGWTAVDQIAVVPQEDFAAYEAKAAALVERLGLYYVFEAEKSFSTDQNEWYTSGNWGGNASNGFVLSCENSTGAAYTDFYVPMNTSLRVALRVVVGSAAGELSVKIDDDVSFFFPLISSTQHFSWVETPSFQLNKGTHRLAVENNGNSRVDFDEAMVFSVHPGEGELPLENLLSSDSNSASCTFVKIDPTRYKIHVRAGAPFFLVFSESWHPSWQIEVDGETLSPILVNSFANGYFIEKTGDFDITLEFKLQVYYTISGYISLISLLAVLAYITHEEIRKAISITKRIVTKLWEHSRRLVESI